MNERLVDQRRSVYLKKKDSEKSATGPLSAPFVSGSIGSANSHRVKNRANKC